MPELDCVHFVPESGICRWFAYPGGPCIGKCPQYRNRLLEAARACEHYSPSPLGLKHYCRRAGIAGCNVFLEMLVSGRPGACAEIEPRVAIPEPKPGDVLQAANGNFVETQGISKLNETYRNTGGWPKKCRDCGTRFTPGSNRQSLCPSCGQKHRRQKQAGYDAKKSARGASPA